MGPKRTITRCDCGPETLHRVLDQRHPGYWVTTLLTGVCKKRSKADGLVLWNHLDFDYPEDEEAGELAEKALKKN